MVVEKVIARNYKGTICSFFPYCESAQNFKRQLKRFWVVRLALTAEPQGHARRAEFVLTLIVTFWRHNLILIGLNNRDVLFCF